MALNDDLLYFFPIDLRKKNVSLIKTISKIKDEKRSILRLII